MVASGRSVGLWALTAWAAMVVGGLTAGWTGEARAAYTTQDAASDCTDFFYYTASDALASDYGGDTQTSAYYALLCAYYADLYLTQGRATQNQVDFYYATIYNYYGYYYAYESFNARPTTKTYNASLWGYYAFSYTYNAYADF